MTKPHSFDDPAGRQLLAAIGKIRCMTSGDPKYHSGRKKKEYASPYLEFLDKARRVSQRMPQIYEFDPGHADGIRHADLDAGERVLNELIYGASAALRASSTRGWTWMLGRGRGEWAGDEPLESPPVSPARGPPTDWGELVQIHDDRDVFQASPDELPAIDIHSL